MNIQSENYRTQTSENNKCENNNNNNNNNDNNKDNRIEIKMEKPNRPTTLQDINGCSPISPLQKDLLEPIATLKFDTRRQSLPMTAGTKLQIPNAVQITNYDNEPLSCPGSPQRRYVPMTPLLTPALSISSLVSSLDGSMENLKINEAEEEEEEEEGEGETKERKKEEATNKLHLDFEAAHHKDIVDNRLKYFFNTLEREEYYEKHSGVELEPLNNIFTNSPMVETRSFQEIRETLTPTNK